MKHQIYISILLFMTLTANGQTGQVYIDYLKVVESLPEYDIGQKQYEQKSLQRQDSLDSLLLIYQKYVRSGIPCMVQPDSTLLAKVDSSLMRMERKMRIYMKQSLDELVKEQEIFEEKLNQIVLTHIELFQTEKGIASIVDEVDAIDDPNSIDFTKELIDFIKAKR